MRFTVEKKTTDEHTEESVNETETPVAETPETPVAETPFSSIDEFGADKPITTEPGQKNNETERTR